MLKNKMDVNLKEDSGTKLTQQRFLPATGQSWIKKCYVAALRSITRAHALEVKNSAKFAKKKKGLHLKPRHFVVVEGIF